MLSAYLPSDKYIFFSLLPLLIPVCIFFLAGSLVVLALLKQWKSAALSLLLLIANMGNLTSLFSLSRKILDHKHSFGVISYNLSFFRIPKVFSKEYFDSTSANGGREIIRYLNRREPAVICLQEFFTDAESTHHNYYEQFLEMGYKSSITAITNPKNKTLRGLAIFTKLPILTQGTIFISESRYNAASYVDVLFSGDTVRVINTHLESTELYFGSKPYQERVKHFWRNFKKAMITRTKQVQLVNEFILRSPHPVLLAGDFNETPYSYNHRVIKETLVNSFEDSGFGFGSTFIKSFLPIRIDHQYFGKGLTSSNFFVDKTMLLSDHYPISAQYSWD